MDLFEKAAKEKLRFSPKSGQFLFSSEELFDLPLTSKKGLSLDQLAMELNQKLEKESNVSFVTKTTVTQTLDRLRFNIILRVIEIKQEENLKNLQSKEKKAKKDQILELLSKKEAETMENKSADELQEILKKLG